MVTDAIPTFLRVAEYYICHMPFDARSGKISFAVNDVDIPDPSEDTAVVNPTTTNNLSYDEVEGEDESTKTVVDPKEDFLVRIQTALMRFEQDDQQSKKELVMERIRACTTLSLSSENAAYSVPGKRTKTVCLQNDHNRASVSTGGIVINYINLGYLHGYDL